MVYGCAQLKFRKSCQLPVCEPKNESVAGPHVPKHFRLSMVQWVWKK